MQKINTLNDNAETTLKNNLIESNIPFKQLGSAFLLPDDLFIYNLNALDGLWIGYQANIEIQEINKDFDLTQNLYCH